MLFHDLTHTLTRHNLLPSKRRRQRVPSGTKHSVRPGVAVPDTAPSVGEVLYPVLGQGQLGRVVTVTWVGVPVELGEGALQDS